MNQRVDIREDIKHYQDTSSYALSKVDYSMGQNIYMPPSDMNLKIRSGTVGYNNKIPVSDEKFSLGKNNEVNLTVPAMKITHTAIRPEPCKCNSNDVLSHTPAISQKNQEPKTITHNNEKIALVLFLQVVLPYGIYFNESSIKCMGHLLRYFNHMSVSLIINRL